MENLSEEKTESSILTDEHSEVLWDMIKDVEEKKEDSLFKLATKLTGGKHWISPNITE